MKTPLSDFVKQYVSSNPARLHMPGHKGKGPLGIEAFDITEVEGADTLYHESGVLEESQKNASLIFGTQKTLYSTQGSTLAIQAMLTLTVKWARERGLEPCIAAGRCAHKSFLSACALLDLDPIWLFPEGTSSLLSTEICAPWLEEYLTSSQKKICAVFITSPDYLGNMADVAALARVCKKHDTLLLVDNAHGAYLHFLPQSHHPMALGATMCCDSAHKTLPSLTGGAYLHIGKDAPASLCEAAKSAMALFASTSPSYLILQSLDLCNGYLAKDFPAKLLSITEKVFNLKKEIRSRGIPTTGQEALKITLVPKPFGYTGVELAAILRSRGIECEFSDPDHTVLMFSTETEPEELAAVRSALLSLPQRDPILTFPPRITPGKVVMTPRQAMLSPGEEVAVDEALGRILCQSSVTCPPAIPIVLCGEVIDESAIEAFRYWGVEKVKVINKKNEA